MADIFEGGTVLIPFLHGFLYLLPLSLFRSFSCCVCAHKFCGCELPVVVWQCVLSVCVHVSVCVFVYLLSKYFVLPAQKFCQPASPGQAGEKATGPSQARPRQGEAPLLLACSFCPAHLPHAKSIYIFHCNQQGVAACMCVCVSRQAASRTKPLHVSGAWPNRFLLIFWDFSV